MKPSLSALLLLSASLLLASCGEEPIISSSPIEEPSSSQTSAEDPLPSSEDSTSDEEKSTTSEDPLPSSEDSIHSSDDSLPSSEESSSSSEDSTPGWAIKVQSTEHIEVEAVDKDGNPLSKGTLWGKVYVKVTIKDPDYGLATLTASYKKKSAEAKTTLDILNLFASAPLDDYRVFTVYDLEEGSEIEISATEKSLNAFKDASFVGDYFYVALSTYGAHDFTAFDATRSLSINAAGEVSLSFRDAFAQIDSVAEDHFLTRSGNVTKKWYVADNLVFASPDENKSPFAYETNDYFFAIKKASADDVASNYRVAIETFTIASVRYMLATVYQGDALYASALAADAPAEAASYFVPNVTVNLLRGSSICATDAVYEILDGEGVRFVVSSKAEGGPSNRVFVSGAYGSFDVSGKSLFLDGAGKAAYDGEEFAATISGSVATLTKGLREIVFDLDLEQRTATLASDTTKAGYDFHGKSYTGTFYSTWDEMDEQVHVSFDMGSSMTTYIRSGANYFFNGNESYATVTPTAYSYDAETYTLTAMVIDCQNKGAGKAFSMVYDPLADTWRITSGDWSNVYTFANCVLTLDA